MHQGNPEMAPPRLPLCLLLRRQGWAFRSLGIYTSNIIEYWWLGCPYIWDIWWNLDLSWFSCSRTVKIEIAELSDIGNRPLLEPQLNVDLNQAATVGIEFHQTLGLDDFLHGNTRLKICSHGWTQNQILELMQLEMSKLYLWFGHTFWDITWH